MSVPISVLCVAPRSNYYKLANKYDLILYDKDKDCTTFDFSTPVITHAPCAQWSRLHHFAKVNQDEKSLAWFCYQAVRSCGGIFEHPSGSHFFRTAQIPKSQIYSVKLSWFGYRAAKPTWLFYNSVSLSSHPLSFDLVTAKVGKSLSTAQRHITPLAFNEWLIQSILSSSWRSSNPGQPLAG